MAYRVCKLLRLSKIVFVSVCANLRLFVGVLVGSDREGHVEACVPCQPLARPR